MQPTIDQHWDNIYNQGRDFTPATIQDIDNFLRYANPAAPKTCLDIGCGTGQLSRELYHRGYQVVGLDVSARAVQIARSATAMPAARLQYLQFDIEHGDLSKLPRQRYGLITCKLVYAFIKDKPAFLERVAQLLRPQGMFVVITPLQEDLPAEKKSIGVTSEEVRLLDSRLHQVAVVHDNMYSFVCMRRRRN